MSNWARLNAKPPSLPDETYTRERPGFEERINALAGKGNWREPSDGARGGELRITPNEHLDAAAIAFARRERGDFGPDVLIAVALQTDSKRSKCAQALADALARETNAKDTRPLLYASLCAWDYLVHGMRPVPPLAMPHSAWEALFKLAAAAMDSERQNAIAAARRARRAA